MKDVFDRTCVQKLKLVRQKLKSAVKDAKNEWVQNKINTLNLQTGTKHAWDPLKALKTGLSKVKPTSNK